MPQQRLQAAANFLSTRIRARIIAPVTPSPPFHCPHAVHPCPSVDSGRGKYPRSRGVCHLRGGLGARAHVQEARAPAWIPALAGVALLLRLARESGYLKRRSMKVAFDTTNILGRGAVKDTCSLLADGMVKLLRALAAVEKSTDKEWAKARGYGRYLASSVKGEAAIDWSDKRARTALLALIVDDADWLLELLELSRQAQGELPEDSEERQRIVAAAELLGQSLLQDVERAEGRVSLKNAESSAISSIIWGAKQLLEKRVRWRKQGSGVCCQ